MECIVFSDTHGNYPLAVDVLSRYANIDMVFHLGDGVEDASLIEHICLTNIQKVAGNCDTRGTYPRELVTLIGKTRVLMTHGDRYGVKHGLSKLVGRGVAAGADIVLYGHTHQASIDEIDGILFVNPGTLIRNSSCKSYARLFLTDTGVQAQILYIQE